MNHGLVLVVIFLGGFSLAGLASESKSPTYNFYFEKNNPKKLQDKTLPPETPTLARSVKTLTDTFGNKSHIEFGTGVFFFTHRQKQEKNIYDKNKFSLNGIQLGALYMNEAQRHGVYGNLLFNYKHDGVQPSMGFSLGYIYRILIGSFFYFEASGGAGYYRISRKEIVGKKLVSAYWASKQWRPIPGRSRTQLPLVEIGFGPLIKISKRFSLSTTAKFKHGLNFTHRETDAGISSVLRFAI